MGFVVSGDQVTLRYQSGRVVAGQIRLPITVWPQLVCFQVKPEGGRGNIPVAVFDDEVSVSTHCSLRRHLLWLKVEERL